MPKGNRLRKLIGILLLPAGMLLLYLSSYTPNLVETLYSKFIYKFIGQLLSTLTGILPFSLAEILVIIFAVLAAGWIILIIIRLIKPGSTGRSSVFKIIINTAVCAGIIYFLFIIIWGLNYSRLPFAAIAKLDVHPASVIELSKMCESLISRTNDLRKKINEDSRGVMYLPQGKQEALKRAYKGYVEASKFYPELGGSFGNPKPVLLSELMSYTGITGVYFPFTAEANVNMKNNSSMIPSTISHEMAHQRGFAREDEANFIAYVTCKVHPDPDFQYSGYLLAVINSMNALYSYDRESYKRLILNYSDGVRRDLRDINEFWQKYEGPVEKISNSINDTYLKANMQNDGVYSYGRMVDLLLAEYRKSQGR